MKQHLNEQVNFAELAKKDAKACQYMDN